MCNFSNLAPSFPTPAYNYSARSAACRGLVSLPTTILPAAGHPPPPAAAMRLPMRLPSLPSLLSEVSRCNGLAYPSKDVSLICYRQPTPLLHHFIRRRGVRAHERDVVDPDKDGHDHLAIHPVGETCNKSVQSL